MAVVLVTSFTVFGVPQPKGSIKMLRTKRGKLVLTSTTRELKPWAHTIVQCALASGVKVIARGPVRGEVSFTLRRPKAAKPTQLFHANRPDLDKLLRAVLDALTGVAWTDAGQVSVVVAAKRYACPGEPAGASVRIGPL